MNETAFLEERLGTTLKDKWRLEALLGYGGMAAVYVGVHKIGRRHAIKILHPEVAASPEVRARFEQEAHAVNLLHHPGAVEVHDFDISEDGCPFLVMELLEGETLAQRLSREEQTDLTDLLSIAEQTLEVLAAAHTEGIVHRDIKPANLFLLRDGTLKVLDFGVARMLEGARSVHTRLGTALGTPTYMPPEQARGELIDGRADLFAVGSTLFRAITRRRIHDGFSDADLLIQMATMPAPPLATIAPHVSQDICLVIDRALAFSRDQRYPHARIMQVDIRALIDGKTPPYASARAVEDPLLPPLVASPLGGGTMPMSARPFSPPSQSGDPDSTTRVESSASGPASEATRAERPSARQPSDFPAKTLTDEAAAPIPLVRTMPDRTIPYSDPPPMLSSTPPPQERSLAWIAVLVVAVLVMLIGGTLGGYWLFQDSFDETEVK